MITAVVELRAENQFLKRRIEELEQSMPWKRLIDAGWKVTRVDYNKGSHYIFVSMMRDGVIIQIENEGEGEATIWKELERQAGLV